MDIGDMSREIVEEAGEQDILAHDEALCLLDEIGIAFLPEGAAIDLVPDHMQAEIRAVLPKEQFPRLVPQIRH